ncbi:MAG: SDR family NAD(P)-dependent oxidoreductase, partial [Gammaproteobacteria bacterium]|nr:SDR family NAD(P)-dependent oxidoreductase [Gammaproteobacteria bacterium]
MIDVAGKVALVTGGASGMGQIIARRLARQGANVAIFDVNEQGLLDTAAEADNITGYHCDISNLDEVHAQVSAV